MKFFFDHFEVLADAPNGVKKLRELILQLAVMGKLVSQDPNDEPASVILEKIKEEKNQLIIERKIKKEELFTKIIEEEPYDMPGNWTWIKIGEVLELINGKAFKPSNWTNSGLPIVRIQNLNNKNAPFNFCDAEIEEKFHIYNGDFLISWSGTPGTSFGAFIWKRGHAILNQHIYKCHIKGGVYTKEFLRIAINSQLHVMISQAHGGVGLQHITKKKLENLFISLPPINEQRRIVAKVDRLMSFCDELEKKKEKRERKRIRLNNASLDKLLSSREPGEFQEHWQRIVDHFDILYNHPGNVAKLKQSILQLAVMGKVVPQDPSDEPAGVLLEKIKKEKERLIKEGKIKRQKPLPPISVIEKKCELPKGWKWCQLNDIIVFGPKNGLSPKPVEKKTKNKILSLSATTSGYFNPKYYKYVSEDLFIKSYLWLEKGDLLIQRGNSIEYVGIAAIYDGPDHEFIYPDLMMKMQVSDFVYIKYIHLCLICMNSRHYFMSKASGTSESMPKVNQSIVSAVPIPLAPISTQYRIVSKVDRLISLCDRLAESLQEADSKREKLFQAVVNQVQEFKNRA